MALSIKKGFLVLCIFAILPSLGFTQDFFGHEFRKFSLTVNGGASFGDTNRGEYFLSSNFSTNTKDTYSFGGGIQYALTPAWSLELGYQQTHIKGLDYPFETQMNMISFRNIINLNQLLMINLITERINPFLTAGVGYDLYNYRDISEKIYNHNSSYNLGAGIAYKLSNTIDLFTHYDYHIGSNEMDNETEGWGADLINSLTAGIRLNFGKPNAIHPSWKPFPRELNHTDYNTLMTYAERIQALSDKIDEIDKQNRKAHRGFDSAINDNKGEIDSLKVWMNLLEQRVEDLEIAFANLEGQINPITVNQETGTAELLPTGHYVQIFASYNLPTAQLVRDHAINTLHSSLQDAEEKIFIIKRKQYYEVLIGVLTEIKDASNIQHLMTGFHKDAYVISFPRPVNLLIDFEDLKVVH